MTVYAVKHLFLSVFWCCCHVVLFVTATRVRKVRKRGITVWLVCENAGFTLPYWGGGGGDVCVMDVFSYLSSNLFRGEVTLFFQCPRPFRFSNFCLCSSS